MLEYYAGVVSMTKRNVITEGKPNINALNKTEQKQFYKELLNFIITKINKNAILKMIKINKQV